MLEFGACPRCKMDISLERRKQTPVICDHCGYTGAPGPALVRKAAEKQTLIIYVSFVTIAVACFMQIMSWDSHWLDSIPVRMKGTIGLGSAADVERMAEICMDLKKWDCVESEYHKAGSIDSTKLSRLGHFQMKRAKYHDAAQSYYSFFSKGGSDLEASYNYAKALAQLGQADEATKYFEQVLAARPDVLQVTVVQNYVKLLIDHGRNDQALRLINDIRGKGPETGSFMESEYQKIKGGATASR